MILERIISIVAEQTGKEASEISASTNFRNDLQIDSLDLFQIINDIEDAFDVKINDVDEIVTIQDAVLYVEKQRS